MKFRCSPNMLDIINSQKFWDPKKVQNGVMKATESRIKGSPI